MYRIEYLQFNELKQEVMSEEDTLQNIIDIWLDCKPNKEQKKYLTNAEEWAKYAFESNEHYVMTVFKEEQLFALVFHRHDVQLSYPCALFLQLRNGLLPM